MGSKRDAPLTVTFPIPRKAAGKLRTMAVSRDRRLLDLGVLAVQINEGESIVLGIKLGKQRIKKTEVSSEKLRGNASRGRVKKPSACRNVATIHHMPNAFSSQSTLEHRLQTTQTAKLSLRNDEEKRKIEIRLDGDATRNNLFNDKTSKKTSGKHFNGSQFHRSDFTVCASELSMNGQSRSAELSAHHNKKPKNNSDYALEEGFISSGSNMQKTMEKPSASPALIASRKTSVESYLSAAQTLSSPGSQRTYSASPSSDTSSTSSEENLDVHHNQLIYKCFLDKSKYSAADMLKELAKAHEAKKVIITTSVVNKTPQPLKTSASTAKSSSSRGSLLQQSKVLVNNKRSNISGSYRDHVKNIRCNSLTSLTTSTSTVNATLKTPASSTDQTLGFQVSRSSMEKPLTSEDKIQSPPTQHTLQHSTASQTEDIKTNTSMTATYHGGRKVLWSSANAFPRSETSSSSAHFLFNKSVTDLPQGNFPGSKNSNLLSQGQETFSETSVRPSCMKDDVRTCSDAMKSTPSENYCRVHTSNKLPQQVSVNETKVTQRDSKTSLTKTPSLSFDSQELVTMQRSSSPHVTSTASLTSFPEATRIVSTEHTSTIVVQNLTVGTPAIPAAPIVVAGTNTQTTWSNQQVSPTYLVGAQGQYGIYSALYSPDVNNNQLGQQSVAAAYPLNYVYPVSFVYPYLTMAAQANNFKSSNNLQENRNAQGTQIDAFIDKTKITKTDSGVEAKEATVSVADVQPTTSTTTPAQTPFIDLASSMRYWQQLSLLYNRSRLQALASCNLSNVSAVTPSSSQVNASSTATSTADSKESPTAVVSDDHENSEVLPFSIPKISQENVLKDSCPENTQTNDFSQENASSEILQPVKPKIALEKENGLQNMTSDRPSVIVVSSCKDGCDSVSKALQSPVKIYCEQEEFDNRGTKGSDAVSHGTSSVEICSTKLHHNRLRHMNDDNMEDAMTARFKRSFYGSPPKLSFIHDSSIACVNVGNSNGNGFGTSSNGGYNGAKKTGW